MKIEKSILTRIGLLFIMIVVSGLVFGSLAEDLVNRETLSTMDPVFGGWLIAHTTLTGNYFFSMITFLGNALVISAGTGLLGFWFAKKKLWSKLRILLSTVGGAALLNFVLKNVFLRTRPDFPLAFLHETGFSFPSGHTMISIAFYGILFFLIFPYLKSWKGKTLVIISWIALSGLIGFSRLYLGAHYLTDVLGGWSVGLMWLLLCVLVNKLFSQMNLIPDAT